MAEEKRVISVDGYEHRLMVAGLFLYSCASSSSNLRDWDATTIAWSFLLVYSQIRVNVLEFV